MKPTGDLRFRALLLGTAAGIAFGLAPSGVLAQDDAADAAEEEIDVERIIVRGFRGSLKKSIEDKRTADQIIDTISAEEIGLFPDQNIAESLQRITGVSITRNGGEGESVSIRGLSPIFTRVEIDGRSTFITIDSSDPERQSVLSIFASELYSTVEVIKSPTAADVAGGIGGIVRLKTPDPLDVGETRFGINGSITDGETRDEIEQGVDGFYIDQFL